MQENVVHSLITTKWGNFNFYVWNKAIGREPIAMVTPNFDVNKPILIRIHSECITGDNLGSFHCDCGEQKAQALQMIQEHGNGMLIYHRQEGRGIGLFEKIKAYQLQSQGIDTHQANVALGHEPDARDYTSLKEIFEYFGIKKIELLTNNPEKIKAVEGMGIVVEKQVLLNIMPKEENVAYLKTKVEKFGHDIKL